MTMPFKTSSIILCKRESLFLYCFFICLLLGGGMTGYAQNGIKQIDKFPNPLYFGRLTEDDFFEKSDFIFDGKRVAVKKIINEDTTKMWTSFIYEITHIFKGEPTIKKGFIEVVRNSGCYYGDGYLGPNMLLLDYNSSYELGCVDRMIFFCKKADTSFQKTENISVAPLENLRYAAFYFKNSPVWNFKFCGLHDLYFKTVYDLYKYMEAKGLPVPDEYSSANEPKGIDDLIKKAKTPKDSLFWLHQKEMLEQVKENKERMEKEKMNKENAE